MFGVGREVGDMSNVVRSPGYTIRTPVNPTSTRGTLLKLNFNVLILLKTSLHCYGNILVKIKMVESVKIYMSSDFILVQRHFT